MEKISYGGWDNCQRLSNGFLETVITADVGPRIIKLSVPGGRNLFKEFPDMMGLTGGDEWRIYGGHRLWHAPEARPRTYHPDNDPVHMEPLDGGLRAIQNVEDSTGIEKQIDLHLSVSDPYARVTHRLINHNLWPVTLSVWGLSVMAPGGTAIMPLPPYQSHEEVLTPSHPLVMWPYTTMNDERWHWGERFIRLRQDSAAVKPQKAGMALTSGWACYALDRTLFIKRYKHHDGATYPDFGCSFETFTNADMLEMESLSPLTRLNPGESVEHVEHWFVFEEINAEGSEREIADTLGSVMRQCDDLICS